MKQKGISARQLQIIMDFPYVQTIYNWFAGKNMPTIDNLVVLAQILEVKMDDLVVTRMLEIEISAIDGAEALTA
ncbi:MAG: helix-turn-helix transcriptional regulator [Spirochaetaceae bacterium]|nr:helix-turn-helix transcriptional regulator [Spirochaetaceae bacterium]